MQLYRINTMDCYVHHSCTVPSATFSSKSISMYCFYLVHFGQKWHIIGVVSICQFRFHSKIGLSKCAMIGRKWFPKCANFGIITRRREERRRAGGGRQRRGSRGGGEGGGEERRGEGGRGGGGRRGGERRGL